MSIVHNLILELLNVMPYPLRFGFLIGFSILLGYFIFGLPVFFLFYYFLHKRSRDVLLRFQSKEQLMNYRLTTVSLSLTFTSSLAFIVSLIFILLSLFIFEESLQTIDWSFQISYLISFCFFLLFTPSTFIWYRFRKRHKVINVSDTIATKEEV